MCECVVNGSLIAVVVAGRLLTSRLMQESHQMLVNLPGSLSLGIKICAVNLLI